MKLCTWVQIAAFSIIFWLLPVDAVGVKPSKIWSDWRKISEAYPSLHSKLERHGRQHDLPGPATTPKEWTDTTTDEETTVKSSQLVFLENTKNTSLETDGSEMGNSTNESWKINQLYAASFLIENYLKLIPDEAMVEAMVENMICLQIKSERMPRGLLDYLDFYSVIGTFWDRYGSRHGDLDWIRMYDTYSDVRKFNKMLNKKKKEANILFPNGKFPTTSGMKSIIRNLNRHPEKTRQIESIVQILKEFSNSARKRRSVQTAMPHLRSALKMAKTAMENQNTACDDMEEDTEHRDKTLETELLWSIGKAIACVLCGVLTPGLCDIACKISL